MIRIGVLITSSFATEVNKFEYFRIPSANRPWLNWTPRKLHFKHQEDEWKNAHHCVTSDGAIVSYLKWKLHGSKIEVDVIFPRELTTALSRNYAIIFCPMVDILEYATIAPSHEQKRFNRVISTIPNVYPSFNVQRLINDKGAYYEFLHKRGVPMIDTLVFREKHLKTKTAMQATIRKIRKRAKTNHWSRIVVKPNTGQEGTRFSVLPKEVDDDRIANALEDILESFDGALVQQYIEGFDRKTMEHRIYTIDDKYSYTVITQRSIDKPNWVKEEGGVIKSPYWRAAKRLAARTCRLIPKSKINGVTLPNMLMRSDIGYKMGKSGDLFLSEQEFVPSLYARECPKNVFPEKLVGESIIKIVKTYCRAKKIPI